MSRSHPVATHLGKPAPLAALLALLVVVAAPLAAQTPKPRTLASPLPPVRPLSELIPSDRALEVEHLLAQGSYGEAFAAAQALLLEEGSASDAPPSSVAADFALLALAQAGLGDRAGAICRWHAAQAFDDTFIGADLSDYGDAGRLLEEHPLEDLAQRKDGPPQRLSPPTLAGEMAVLRPELIENHPPQYTLAARQARIAGVVILEAVIATDGTVSHVRVLKGLPLGLSATSIDAVCDWRFKPATRNGEPVEVYYVLTVNYQVQDAPRPTVKPALPNP